MSIYLNTNHSWKFIANNNITLLIEKKPITLIKKFVVRFEIKGIFHAHNIVDCLFNKLDIFKRKYNSSLEVRTM